MLALVFIGFAIPHAHHPSHRPDLTYVECSTIRVC
jgi:hypothetical protein